MAGFRHVMPSQTGTMEFLKGDVELTTRLAGANVKKAAIFFCASWHEPSMQMAEAWGELITLHLRKDIVFLTVEAETAPKACERYGVTSVPTFVLICGDSQEIVEGADVELLSNKVKAFVENENPKESSGNKGGALDNVAGIKRVKELLRESDTVMLFMKGSPSTPYCKFSKKAIALLEDEGIQFSSFDVLKDEAVRQGIKIYSDFPTFPQLYVRGELVGGVDIMLDMLETAKSAGGGLKTALGLPSTSAINTEEKTKQGPE